MTASAARLARPIAGVSLEVALATVLVVGLAFAAGDRWFGTGRDYLFYVEFYDRLGLATKITEERFEPGFTAGAWLFKYGLGLPYGSYATVLVGAALTTKFAVFFRHCDHPLLACLVYCAAFYPLHEYTQLRVAVALAFGLLGTTLAVDRRPLLGGAIIVAGALFQSSEIVVGLGVAIALLLRLRPLVIVLLGVALGVAVPLLMPADPVAVLAQINPLAQDYISQLDVETPNFFNSSNIVTMIAVGAMLPVVLRQRTRIGIVSLILSLLSPLSFALLRDIPTFAHRFREMFALFVVPLVFGGPTTPIRQGLRLVVTLGSVWQLRQFIADGVVS